MSGRILDGVAYAVVMLGTCALLIGGVSFFVELARVAPEVVLGCGIGLLILLYIWSIDRCLKRLP